MNDPSGLETLKKYKQQFERGAVIADAHNAHYRVRSNFALMYGATALAIDYEILPWGTGSTFRAIEKCMRLALAMLETGNTHEPSPTLGSSSCIISQDPVGAARPRRNRTCQAQAKSEQKAGAVRQKADGFKINGEIYVKPDQFKRWIPAQYDRNALKEQKMIVTGRKDTATVEKKIGGIKGKPRYYAIELFAPCVDWHREVNG